MPFDQPSSSTGDCEFSNAITAAVLAEIAAGGVPAIANELSPQATDPFGGLFVIWLLNIGRFCLTVRTGRYALHEDSWRLDTGAESERVPSPLAQAWDEAVLVSRTIHRKLLRRVMIAPAVAFPDTMPDARIRRVAQRSRVVVVWDLDDLARRGRLRPAAQPTDPGTGRGGGRGSSRPKHAAHRSAHLTQTFPTGSTAFSASPTASHHLGAHSHEHHDTSQPGSPGTTQRP